MSLGLSKYLLHVSQCFYWKCALPEQGHRDTDSTPEAPSPKSPSRWCSGKGAEAEAFRAMGSSETPRDTGIPDDLQKRLDLVKRQIEELFNLNRNFPDQFRALVRGDALCAGRTAFSTTRNS